MPKLPDVTALGQRPIAQPSRQLGRLIKGSSGAEALPHLADVELGQTVVQIGDALLRQHDRFTTLQAEDAYTKLLEKRLDLSEGEDGFTKKLHDEAMGKPFMDDYVERFDQSVSDISEPLSDKAKEKFTRRANVARIQYRQDVMEHSSRQSDAYAKKVYESAVDTEMRNASSHWDNPNDIKMSVNRIDFLINEEGSRLNLPAKKIKAMKDIAESNVHLSVVERMLINDQDITASHYYNANKKNFMGNDAAKAEQAIAEGSLRGESRRQAERIMLEFQTEGQALREAKKIKNPKVYDATVNRIKRSFADQEAAHSLRVENAYTDASQIVEQTGSTDSIDPHTWVSILGDREKKALKKRADEISLGKEPEMNNKKFMQFLDIPANELADMNRMEVETQFLMDFDRQNRILGLERWQDARQAAQGDPLAEIKHASTIQFDDIVDGYARQFDILPEGISKSKLGEEEVEVYNNFRFEADRAIKQFERTQLQGKRKATSEEMEKVVSGLLAKKVYVDRWWSDPEKPIAALTEEEREDAYVPIDDIPANSVLAIKRHAESLKTTVSQRQIERAYAAALMGADDQAIMDILTGAE